MLIHSPTKYLKKISVQNHETHLKLNKLLIHIPIISSMNHQQIIKKLTKKTPIMDNRKKKCTSI